MKGGMNTTVSSLRRLSPLTGQEYVCIPIELRILRSVSGGTAKTSPCMGGVFFVLREVMTVV